MRSATAAAALCALLALLVCVGGVREARASTASQALCNSRTDCTSCSKALGCAWCNEGCREVASQHCTNAVTILSCPANTTSVAQNYCDTSLSPFFLYLRGCICPPGFVHTTPGERACRPAGLYDTEVSPISQATWCASLLTSVNTSQFWCIAFGCSFNTSSLECSAPTELLDGVAPVTVLQAPTCADCFRFANYLSHSVNLLRDQFDIPPSYQAFSCPYAVDVGPSGVQPFLMDNVINQTFFASCFADPGEPMYKLVTGFSVALVSEIKVIQVVAGVAAIAVGSFFILGLVLELPLASCASCQRRAGRRLAPLDRKPDLRPLAAPGRPLSFSKTSLGGYTTVLLASFVLVYAVYRVLTRSGLENVTITMRTDSTGYLRAPVPLVSYLLLQGLTCADAFGANYWDFSLTMCDIASSRGNACLVTNVDSISPGKASKGAITFRNAAVLTRPPMLFSFAYTPTSRVVLPAQSCINNSPLEYVKSVFTRDDIENFLFNQSLSQCSDASCTVFSTTPARENYNVWHTFISGRIRSRCKSSTLLGTESCSSSGLVFNFRELNRYYDPNQTATFSFEYSIDPLQELAFVNGETDITLILNILSFLGSMLGLHALVRTVLRILLRHVAVKDLLCGALQPYLACCSACGCFPTRGQFWRITAGAAIGTGLFTTVAVLYVAYTAQLAKVFQLFSYLVRTAACSQVLALSVLSHVVVLIMVAGPRDIDAPSTATAAKDEGTPRTPGSRRSTALGLAVGLVPFIGPAVALLARRVFSTRAVVFASSSSFGMMIALFARLLLGAPTVVIGEYVMIGLILAMALVGISLHAAWLEWLISRPPYRPNGGFGAVLGGVLLGLVAPAIGPLVVTFLRRRARVPRRFILSAFAMSSFVLVAVATALVQPTIEFLAYTSYTILAPFLVLGRWTVAIAAAFARSDGRDACPPADSPGRSVAFGFVGGFLIPVFGTIIPRSAHGRMGALIGGSVFDVAAVGIIYLIPLQYTPSIRASEGLFMGAAFAVYALSFLFLSVIAAVYLRDLFLLGAGDAKHEDIALLATRPSATSSTSTMHQSLLAKEERDAI